jgi:tyrosyl-tRNA synthetase
VLQAEKISKILFGWEDIIETITWCDSNDIDALAQETWSIAIQETEVKVLDIFTQSGLTSSNGEAKKMIQSWSLFINEIKVEDPQLILSKKEFINGVLLLRKGKKQYKIVRA